MGNSLIYIEDSGIFQSTSKNGESYYQSRQTMIWLSKSTENVMTDGQLWLKSRTGSHREVLERANDIYAYINVPTTYNAAITGRAKIPSEDKVGFSGFFQMFLVFDVFLVSRNFFHVSFHLGISPKDPQRSLYSQSSIQILTQFLASSFTVSIKMISFFVPPS